MLTSEVGAAIGLITDLILKFVHIQGKYRSLVALLFKQWEPCGLEGSDRRMSCLPSDVFGREVTIVH